MKIFVLLLLSTLILAQPGKEELKGLESDAIVFGAGLNRVYAFVDPMCSNCKNYIDLISSSEKLQKQNTYFVFLYRLNKFDSDWIIDSIYMAQDPKKELVDVLAEQKEPLFTEPSPAVKAKRERINSIADKTQMTRRPYVVQYLFGSDVCRVSEGDAPCMVKHKEHTLK